MSTLDVVNGVIELDNARGQYAEAEAMYEGTAKEVFVSSAVENDLKKTSGTGRFNLIKRIVHTVTNRLKLSSITVPDDESANAQLELIRIANDMDIYENLIIRKTEMYGDSYVLIWDVDSEDLTEDENLRMAGISLTYNSPIAMRMIYDPSNNRKALYAIKAWKDGDRRRADLYYRDRVERYITVQDHVDGHELKHWTTFTAEVPDLETGELVSDNGIIAHEFGEIPVIHFRNDLPFGVPGAIDGHNPQRAINKALVTLIATLEQQGYPARYLLMDPAAVLNTGSSGSDEDFADEIPMTQEEIDLQAKRKSTATFSSAPGVIQRIQGAKSAGSWDTAKPEVFLNPIMAFIKLMALATETPAYELNPDGEQPSGEARKQADKPLESKVANRQAFLKGPFKNLYRIALKGLNVIVDDVDVQWAPTSPINDSEGWSTIKAKQDAGVPIGQTLTEAGYSEELINSWLDNIAEATTLDQKVETLGNIATALKDLGSAKTLEVISAEQIETIIESLILSLTTDQSKEGN